MQYILTKALMSLRKIVIFIIILTIKMALPSTIGKRIKITQVVAVNRVPPVEVVPGMLETLFHLLGYYLCLYTWEIKSGSAETKQNHYKSWQAFTGIHTEAALSDLRETLA